MANNPIKYSDLIQYTDDIEKLIKQLTDADAAYTTLSQHIKTQAKEIQSGLKMVSGATDDGRKKIAQAAAAAEKLVQTEKAVAAADKEVVKAKEQLVTVQERVWRGYVNIDTAIKGVMGRDYAAYVKRTENGMVSYADAINRAAADTTRLITVQKQLDADLSAGRISAEQYKASMDEVTIALDKASMAHDRYISLGRTSKESTTGTSTLDEFRALDSQLQQLAINYQSAKQDTQALRAEQKALNDAYKEGAMSQEVYTERSASLDVALRNAKADEDELAKRLATRVKLLNSAAGSYNELSARYSEITRELNGMGTVEGEELKRKEALTAEAADLIEQMKALKDAVGNNQLEVGSYEKAIKAALDPHMRFRTRVMELRDAMMQLRLEGKENTEEYRTLAAEAGRLSDIQADINRETREMASDTSTLNSVLGALSVGSGALSTTVGLMNLWGGESEDVAAAQKKLQAAIAVTTGLQSIQNATQKQSALMLGVSKIQTLALTAAQKIQARVTAQNTTATIAQTVAMKALNLVAKASPWGILATGIGLVGAALFAFTGRSNNAEVALSREKEALDELSTAYDENLNAMKRNGATSEQMTTVELRQLSDLSRRYREHFYYVSQIYDKDSDEYQKALADKLDADQRYIMIRQQLYEDIAGFIRDANEEQRRFIEGDAAVDKSNIRSQANSWISGIEGDIVNSKNIILDTQKEIERLTRKRNLNNKAGRYASASGAEQLKRDNDEIDSQLRAAQAKLNDAEKQVQEGLNSIDQLIDARDNKIAQIDRREAERQNAAAQSTLQAARDAAQQQLDLERKLRDERIKSIEDDTDREIVAEGARVDDLISAIKQGSKELSDTEMALIAQYEANYEAFVEQKIEERDRKIAEAEVRSQMAMLAREKEALDLRLAAIQENTDEYLRLRQEAIRKEEEMELAKNAALDKDQQQSEADIRAKYDKRYADESLSIMMSMFDQQQEYEAAAFNATVHTEEERTEFQLQQQVARLEQMREYYRALGLLTAEQEQYINDLIAGAHAQNSENKKSMLGGGMIGGLLSEFNVDLSDKAIKAINATDIAMEQSMSLIGEYISAWQELAQAKVDAANQEVEAAQRVVDYEMQARANGYANNVALAQQELDEKKRLQQEALKEQQKAQKAQEAIDTVSQTVNLVTAASQIFKAVAGLGVFGVPLAVTLIGTMFAAFAAAKIKAAQATKASTEQYGEGTVELLRGGSHSSGHDIDMGTKPDGTRRRAEGGEFFAIINKRSSRRFRSLIPGVIDSLNKGDFPERYMRMYDASRLQLAVAGGGGTDISRVERDLHAIRKRGETRQYVDGRGDTVIITGNRTRRIINK